MFMKVATLLSLALAAVAASSGWYGRERTSVMRLYQAIKQDMEVGREVSDKLMVHSIQGLVLVQNHSISMAAQRYHVSEEFIIKILETNPFETNSVNAVLLPDLKNKTEG